MALGYHTLLHVFIMKFKPNMRKLKVPLNTHMSLFEIEILSGLWKHISKTFRKVTQAVPNEANGHPFHQPPWCDLKSPGSQPNLQAGDCCPWETYRWDSGPKKVGSPMESACEGSLEAAEWQCEIVRKHHENYRVRMLCARLVLLL